MSFTPLPVHRYGKTATVHIATVRRLWYGTFGPQPVTVILLRETTTPTRGGYDTALVTTDTLTRPAGDHSPVCRSLVDRSHDRRCEAAHRSGTGPQPARSRRRAHRPPFGLTCQTLTMLWYATVGHTPTDVADHRDQAP